MPTRVLIPSGALGLGFDEAALARGVEARPDIICIDGGSTDSGPYYLGTGTSKYSRASTLSEWRRLMKARARAGVPLVIGTAGTCGTDATVDWMAAITKDAAEALGQKVKVALVYSSQDPAAIAAAMGDGRVTALQPEIPADEQVVARCSNIVALAGAEQIAAAIDTGADIVIAGRTTDTAIIAALPLMRGDHPGAAWHGAKIGECGALCSTHPTSGVIMVEFDGSGFTVEPFADGARCTPHSVSAHMLYENADPFVLHEPGGHLDVTHSSYEPVDDRRVRVSGSAWVPADRYSVKLEGARIVGYQTMLMATLREPRYVAAAQEWVDRLTGYLRSEIGERLGLSEKDYSLDFRLIGVDATLGKLENRKSQPVEVGVLCIVTASSQALADEIGKITNPQLLHFPLSDDEPQATFAFPYSPAESTRGALFEFCLNHVLELDDPLAGFRIETMELGHAASG